ncbi:MAG: hypothetical protein ACPGSC_00355 [Granulosicoccaceae bacterium]
MNTDSQTREWLFALAASKLAAGEVRGERPSLVEIEKWRLGKLQQTRAREVLSYVAHDEQCHTQWRELCAEQRWLDSYNEGAICDQPNPQSVTELKQTPGWLGGVAARLGLAAGRRPRWASGVAAALFALLVIPVVFLPSDDPFAETYLQQVGAAEQLLGVEYPPVLGRLTKAIGSLDGTVKDQDKLQFQMGLSAAAAGVPAIEDERWAAWRDSLPPSIDCNESSSEHCSSTGIRNQALGSWSLVTSLACGSGAHSEPFWEQQAAALQALTEKAVPADHFLALRLQKPLPYTRVQLCAMATGLLGQGG